MSYGTRWMVLMTALIAITGCGGNELPAQGSAAGHEYGSDYRKESFRKGGREALRIWSDAARSRQWALTPDGVRVYDVGTKALIREIVLPGWSIARILCHPDLALDRSGSAYVSSNIEPKLWRIDGDSFEVGVREIRLNEREQWDVGFGALAFSAEGTLFAMTYRGGTLWRVDIQKGDARMVRAYPGLLKPCELTPQLVSGFERSE
jgi:hypothetical protein